jgi:hypothetical protein
MTTTGLFKAIKSSAKESNITGATDQPIIGSSLRSGLADEPVLRSMQTTVTKKVLFS